MNNSYTTVQTARLTLQPLIAADANVLHHIYQSEGVLRYFPNPDPPTLDRVRRFIDSQQSHWVKYGYGNWGVLPRGEDKIIGWAGLQYLPELSETEVGFLLDRPHWGKGYATEAARAALQFGFDTLHLDYIIALVHPENLASIGVLEKCGMSYIETIKLWGIELQRYYAQNVKRA